MATQNLKWAPAGQNLEIATDGSDVYLKIDGKGNLGDTGSGKNVSVAKGAMAGKTFAVLGSGENLVISVTAYKPKS